MDINQSKGQSGILEGGVRKAVILSLALLSLFLFAKAINEFKTYSVIGRDVAGNNTITVSGKGEVVGVPDIATFSYSVTEESLSITDAQEKSAKTVNAIMDYLKKNGVDEKDIKTSGYNIYPRYDYVNATYYTPGKQVLAAYVVSQSTEVKVRKIADAGKLIGAIGELGANNISGLTFTFDKEEALKDDARKDAINEARENASVIARGLGVTLGRVVNFSENSSLPYMAYGMGGAMKLDVASAPAPEIAPGESKIISNVTITYELK